nr:hypothetical protein [Allomuricauda sp.]
MRKFWGILLLIIGILLVFIAIGRLTSLISSVLELAKIFDSDSSGHQKGQIIGRFLYWVIHFAILYFSFKYGSRMITKKKMTS